MKKSFRNTLFQNIILFTLFITLTIILSNAFQNPLVYRFGFIIRPKKGIHQIVEYLTMFNLLVLPWRPVRRFLWNISATIIDTIKPVELKRQVKNPEYTMEEVIEINEITVDQSKDLIVDSDIDTKDIETINEDTEIKRYSSSRDVYNKLMNLTES